MIEYSFWKTLPVADFWNKTWKFVSRFVQLHVELKKRCNITTDYYQSVYTVDLLVPRATIHRDAYV